MTKIKHTPSIQVLPSTKIYDGKELKKKNHLRPGAYSLDTTPSLYCGVLYFPNGATKEFVNHE